MAFAKTTVNHLPQYYESYTLPSSATTEYSSIISQLRPTNNGSTRYITVTCTASAVSGTNLDIGLYGAQTTTGTKTLLKDAIVTDLQTGALTATGSVDLNAYVYPYYFIGWTADANESANTIGVYVYSTYEDPA